MSLISDDHSVEVGGATVSVRAKTGLVQATWSLLVDDTEVDSATASGDFKLRGTLPDGSPVEAQVFQSLIGPTEVAILHEGREIERARGFVA